MKKPVLVVMAAGMSSRYGSLKQIDPVGNHGQLIIDYSVYDAIRAGFERVIFIIKRENDAEFREAIGNRLAGAVQVEYAYQELSDLPDGFEVPQGRVKPWGTTQAVLAARDLIDGPFAVVNADDYYGPEAFRLIYEQLTRCPEGNEYCMVSYLLGKTVTEHGGVTRGICEVSEDGCLQKIVERKGIEKNGEDAFYRETDGSPVALPGSTVVSMNFWGFTASFLDHAKRLFPQFLERTLSGDAMKEEFYLPAAVGQLLEEASIRVQVLRSSDQWFGVTYREDKPSVVQAIARLTAQGLYPDDLWRKSQETQ